MGGLEGVPEGWLVRRLAFCEARVAARTEALQSGDKGRPKSSERLILADLHRELGALHLLRDDIDAAFAQVRQAGEIFSREGYAQGLVLRALAGDTAPMSDPLARRVVETARNLDQPRHLERGFAQSSPTELYSPHQWLSVLQAITIVRSRSTGVEASSDFSSFDGEDAVLVDRLRPQASLSLANGQPFGPYLDLLSSPISDHVPASRDEEVLELLAWRRRAILTAMKDRYHWGRSLDAVALIDFDLIALFVCRPWLGEAIAYGGPPRLADSLVRLPIELAARLRGPRPIEPWGLKT